VVKGIQVSNWLRPWKRSRVEVEESDEESEWSGLGGRKTWVETGGLPCLGEIQGLLREKNGLLKRIAQGLVTGLGASSEEEVEDSTIRRNSK